MSATIPADAGRPRRSGDLAYHARIVKVLAGTAFKVKYADSVLGYFWSLARPLALFSILYVIFGRALGLGATNEHYPLFLLLGIALFTFFQDATTRTMTSIVDQSPLLRKIAFPRIIIPVSATVTALITFGLSLVAVAIFVAWSRIAPDLSWLLLVPLLLELYVFVLGVSLILATLFARFQDIGAIWEIAIRVFFYGFGIIFPLELLPGWAERLIALNPFTQVMQDVRAIVLPGEIVTAADVLGGPIGRLAPIAIAAAIFVASIVFFKRHESWFAERA